MKDAAGSGGPNNHPTVHAVKKKKTERDESVKIPEPLKLKQSKAAEEFYEKYERVFYAPPRVPAPRRVPTCLPDARLIKIIPQFNIGGVLKRYQMSLKRFPTLRR